VARLRGHDRFIGYYGFGLRSRAKLVDVDSTPDKFDKDEIIVRNRLRPKDAATLVLVRQGQDGPRVLMGRRHGSMAFMANKYVFPGGRVDLCDRRLSIGGEFQPHVAARLKKNASEALSRALGLAAMRETFEEAGILIGERCEKLPRSRSAWSRFFAHGVAPKLDVLEFIARAITPPNRTRRFDARFFMADASAIAHQLNAAHSDELLTPCWLTFAEARALDVPSVTRLALDEVQARVRNGADPSRPVPFFRFLRGKSQLDYL
jgi:8-oxo-dGTP pyrophosphatase MutT (NUDIX family)